MWPRRPRDLSGSPRTSLAHLAGVEEEFKSRTPATSPPVWAAAGYSEDEIRGAWNYARQAGYTEATGLGQDRLTDAGRERALSF